MLAAFLIMLREGIEAALIIGIVASYLRHTGRRAWLPTIWVGVFLAVAVSLLVGTGLITLSREFPQKLQEMFEAAVGIIAVAVLTWMVFWMRRAAASIRDGLHSGIERAIETRSATWGLIGLAFFAVAREGLESVFFLLAILQQSPGPGIALAALAGVLISAALGYLIYQGGVRINLRHFFRWTGVFILFVAAGLCASVVQNLHEAGLWNGLQEVVYDASQTLPVNSVVGTILAGVFGYAEAPNLGQLVVWLTYLTVTLYFFLRPVPPTFSRRVATSDGRA